MTDFVPSPPLFRDAPARRPIADDLETNLLVEAGAGSGKTTELVNRMVALLASGTAQMGEIAAVTFTRKASAELRERFQVQLESEARAATRGGEGVTAVHERLRPALHDMDQEFVGQAERVKLERGERPPPSALEYGATERVDEAALAAAQRVAAAGSHGYSFISVTSAAKDATASVVATGSIGPKPAAQTNDSRFRRFSWGGAVHGALAVATEGLDADTLWAACRSLLVEHGRPVDDHGDPVELAELIELVTAVRKSELWLRAGRALRVYTEIPLAAREQVDGRVAQPPSEKLAPRRRVHGAA